MACSYGREIKYLYYLIVLLFAVGCKQHSNQEPKSYIPSQDKVKSGFIVCRLGNGFFSNYFRKTASKERRYSHIGILSKENGDLYVYHAEASELTGIGFVKREPLASFLKDVKTYDFFEFNYSDSIKNKVLEEVKAYYTKKTPFDLNFDTFNDNEVYCTELIAISVNKALDSVVITPSLQLHSKIIYGLDDIYTNENIHKVNFSD